MTTKNLDQRVAEFKESKLGFLYANKWALEELIDDLIADRQRLLDERKELVEALKIIFQLMDDGYLVRDTSHDHDPDWSIKALKLAMTLKKSYEVLDKLTKDNSNV